MIRGFASREDQEDFLRPFSTPRTNSPGFQGRAAFGRARVQKRGRELKRGTDAYFAAKYGWSFANVHNNGDLSTDVFLSEVERGVKERVVRAEN